MMNFVGAAYLSPRARRVYGGAGDEV
jgi:hypothetical protein